MTGRTAGAQVWKQGSEADWSTSEMCCAAGAQSRGSHFTHSALFFATLSLGFPLLPPLLDWERLTPQTSLGLVCGPGVHPRGRHIIYGYEERQALAAS